MQVESSNSVFAQECLAIRSQAGGEIRAQVADLVTQQASVLADLFYARMFEVPEAAALLDHGEVNSRLRGSMNRWLVQLFDDRSPPEALAQAQRRTGEVHARIGVPPVLVSRGARMLTRAIVEHLAARAARPQDAARAAQYVYEMFALALDAMVAAYAQNASRLARSDEAFRLFFLGQDMKAERERRRSELLEWAQQIMERHYWGDGDEPRGVASGGSAFSMWLDHKAVILFDGAPEVALIRTAITRVEQQLLPELSRARGSHQDARTVAGEIHACIGEIKALLGAMFDRYVAVEDGRDSVTALLNRRYFPAVARREIDLALARHHTFSVLMVSIDHFTELAPALGLERAELVLARVAELLQDSVRAGDFVFRIGDDEFVLLLVEADRLAAQRVADGLQRRVAAAPVRLAADAQVDLSLSVGGAEFDRHPDYQRLLDRADAALRRAQAAGAGGCAFEA